ncbi:MAG: winged helix-turn-helix transcriptional regulator [Promethearchaeota archaeon]
MNPIENIKKKPALNLSNFKEFIELLPRIQEAIQFGAMREFQENKSGKSQAFMVSNYIDQFFILFNKKWTGDVIITINYLKEPYFNDIKNWLNLINTRTLVSRLASLKKLGIIERIIHDTQPVRVSYKMTPFGEDLCSIFTSLMLYYLLNNKDK